ncbi:conserved Plasmodium protein, unknown function [Plasmodium malariae]|uniref:Uncharacterized protein n=1 Tax=Plasmodium malariae TaxID=5858 RepID=A0A1A8WVJ5_PLAMA|nr:conserved Plasmodium protein, unknown function [Plasmodium malariae]
MGNFIGYKENNVDGRNINIFEKRYGYNLNDLHSYIYKINLPLKPRYINYVLEEKQKGKNKIKSSEDSLKEKEPDDGNEKDRQALNYKHNNSDSNNYINSSNNSYNNSSRNSNSNSSGSSSNQVDIYHKYERENINNPQNVYKNKIVINNVESNEKYEDKYVHISYDKNYIYDEQKNNIYTDDNISSYISQENDILSDKNKFSTKKTYVNLCLNYYNNLDTCVTKKYQKNVQSRKYKFTRLHTCKPHYILFSRCIKYRDRKLMNEIKKIELNYYSSLNRINRSIYLNEFSTNLGYHEYLISKQFDSVEKIKLNKELSELRERYNHILKYNLCDDHLPKFDKQKRKTYSDNEKKYILLNI